jgi:hypothetical protein
VSGTGHGARRDAHERRHEPTQKEHIVIFSVPAPTGAFIADIVVAYDLPGTVLASLVLLALLPVASLGWLALRPKTSTPDGRPCSPRSRSVNRFTGNRSRDRIGRLPTVPSLRSRASRGR